MSLAEELRSIGLHDVDDSHEVLEAHSRDTSLFQVMPEVVVFPRSAEELEVLVQWVTQQKKEGRNISITGRSAGTDMTGGPLNESIIVSFTKYMNAYAVDEQGLEAHVEPGLYYREFEKEILSEHLTMPTYPSSKTIAALGGMIMNNCGGEQTLRYGQMREFVTSIDMVLADGNTYTFGPLTEDQLEATCSQNTFEGRLYRSMKELIVNNWDTIKANQPHVSKNSSGYALWRVWDENTKIFNLAHLFVGSQGTLGLLSHARLRLLPEKTHRRMIVTFFPSWDNMPDFVTTILPYSPESLEAFDDATLKLGIRFMPEVARSIEVPFWKFALRFLPEVGIGIKMLRMPKLVIIIELAEDTEDELDRKTTEIEEKLRTSNILFRTLHTKQEEDKYWAMRRESFNLLRKHVAGKQTAPFIEDFCLNPKDIPAFLPQIRELLKRNGITMNIAGHAGNGNFHIIPLMDLTQASEREKLPRVAEEYYKLIQTYRGSISAEHNDGILRTPYLNRMYSPEMLALFKQVKDICDPLNIFNPGKKIALEQGIGTKEYSAQHIKAK